MALFRKTPEAVPESLEKHLRLLVESSPEGMVICDSSDRVVFANAEFCRMFGWKRTEVIGSQINNLVANSDETRAEASMVSSSALSSPHVLPDTFRAGKNKRNIPVSLLAGPIHEGGKAVGIYGIYRDRSREMKSEAAASQEKVLFEKLFRSSPDAITLENTEGEILKANDAFYDMFGYSGPDEVIGKNANAIVARDPEIREECTEMDRRFWKGENIDQDVVRQRKDGSYLHLAMTQTPFSLPDGALLDYVIYRDIEDRIRAEHELRESERRYAAIVEDQVEMVCRFRPDGEATFVNDAFCLFFGIRRDQILSLPLRNVMGNRNAEAICAGNEALCQDCHSVFFEHVCDLPSGEKRWLRWSKRGIFDGNGSLVEIQAVGRDTTEIKRTEEELRHLNNVIQSIRGVNRLINRHHDSERLVQEICAHLIETRGYRNVWIGILGSGGKLASVSEAGIGPDGSPLSERIKQGALNEWGLSILEKPGVSLKHGIITMTDCPLLDSYEESGIMATRLEYDGKVYGLISVSIPAETHVDREEQPLFAELAEDIAFALHAIEVEHDQKEKADALGGQARQLELLTLHHSDGLWEWDLKEGKVNMNPNYETMLGYDPGELDHSFEGVQSKIHPEDLHGVLAALETVVEGQGNGDLYEAVYRMRTKDGGWMKILDNGYVVRRDRFGRARRMVGTHILIPDTPTGEMKREDPES